jgi:hypothetical protein
MFKRKLTALDYGKDYDPQGKILSLICHLSKSSYVISDENQFRQMVVWLEDMKIRLYPIDGRQTLRDIQNSEWEQTLCKVICSIESYFYFIFYYSIYKI